MVLKDREQRNKEKSLLLKLVELKQTETVEVEHFIYATISSEHEFKLSFSIFTHQVMDASLTMSTL